MSTQDELLAVFRSYDQYNFDPAECLQRCLALLAEACVPGGPCDPRDAAKVEQACNAFGFASGQFLHNRLPSAATSLLIQGWNDFSQVQADTGHRIYRAGLGMYLAKAYLTLGDTGASLRWALLTQADDLLGRHGAGGGAGRQLLVSALGLSRTQLDAFGQLGLEALQRADAVGWNAPAAYPEDILTKFAFRYPEHAQILATPSSEFQFPLNAPYLRSLIAAANQDGLSSTEKGRRLEDVATYTFMLLPGLVPRRNVLDEALAFETDIVVRNLTPHSSLQSDLLGRHFLAECKNWANPVGVQEIGYFLYRIRLTHAFFGVMFASHGITGNQDQETAARSLVRKAFHEDGTICIVVDATALDDLCQGQLSLWAMLLDRLERVRFGKAR